ncbi:hypothetical protein HGO34_15770 [Agrobacterium vitis]|uniref:hypothetical protein n=1 Tax=Agrobacterium vitis TaxID=373 RepID=UPI001F1D39C7|nr:hypothetical protein [Agrobacterium vitis]MCF1498918.1 hypothetical protein [Allorhizobium sp. Av2]MCM2441180.1 hypothetical protein [Agrobacterium vitis]
MDNAATDSTASLRADAFAQELSELGRKHGIGIAEPVTLYVLEDEDKMFNYACDENSVLRLT